MIDLHPLQLLMRNFYPIELQHKKHTSSDDKNVLQLYRMKHNIEGEFMHEISVRDARNALGNLDQYLAENGELIITKHGKQIARILPMHEQIKRPSHQDLRSKMGESPIDSTTLIREDRDER